MIGTGVPPQEAGAKYTGRLAEAYARPEKRTSTDSTSSRRPSRLAAGGGWSITVQPFDQTSPELCGAFLTEVTDYDKRERRIGNLNHQRLGVSIKERPAIIARNQSEIEAIETHGILPLTM